MNRIPASKNTGIEQLFCGPESFTPDMAPLVGPAPELQNFWVAAGLRFAVKFDKPGGFIGREALLRQNEEGVKLRLVQFLVTDPEPLLHAEEPIYRNGERVGYIKSGGYGHTLGGAVGLGPVENPAGVTPDYVNSGSYEIEISGKRYPARASLRPMYDPQGLRIRS
jgi:glycine cleavage system aminomethyltransferase T